jgi:CRP-like cAMP-binding protein
MKHVPNRELSGNQLLDALPPRQRDCVLARAEPVHLDMGQLQFRQAEPISTVHFPTTAVLSLITLLRDGTAIEVSTIGNEGTTAAPVFLGPGVMSNAQCICQIVGDAIAIRAEDFQRAVENSPALQDIMKRYVAALLTQVGQAVACSRLHNTTQRCARWLLMTHDRVTSDEFHLTHEFLSFMLGSRRASVTEVLGSLNKANVVSSHRGDIRIVDRRGLHRLSCECYDVITEAMNAVGPTVSTR